MKTENDEKIGGFIVGPSGVGKGYAVGGILKEYENVKIFVSGDWCREMYPSESEKGHLIGDEKIFVANNNYYLENDSPSRFMFDCPRSLSQAEKILAWFKSIGIKKTFLLHVYAEKQTCIYRIYDRAKREKRVDDLNMESINRRLDTYFDTGGLLTTVIPFLRINCDFCLEIDANGSLNNVRAEMLERHCPNLFGTKTAQKKYSKNRDVGFLI